MLRRIHVHSITSGELRLPTDTAHYLRDVLRLETGNAIELFDNAGGTAVAAITRCNPQEVVVRAELVRSASRPTSHLTIATAIPKANRADWMIEKLSELGIDRFIPLQTARSVVHPEGKNKIERWQRLAVEAARQSRRSGVMSVEPLIHLAQLVAAISGQGGSAGWYLSTAVHRIPVRSLLRGRSLPAKLTMFIGPEGGWTEQEMATFDQVGFSAVGLTETVLRVETAALAAAVLVAVARPGEPPSSV